MSDCSILRVAVPAPVHRVFDYGLPKGVEASDCQPGMRVRVPFGKRTVIGLVVGGGHDPAVAQERLKPALELLDTTALLAAADLRLLDWAASYYQHPLGEVIFTTLPAVPRHGKALPDAGDPGWRLTTAGREVAPASLSRAPRQKAVLTALADEPDGLSRAALFRGCGSSAQVLRSLADKGWIERCTLADSPAVHAPVAGPGLNPGQQQAVSAVSAALGHFHAFLLDGVTGSGKTEVYLTLAEQVIARGGQVLVLVPEIALAPQLERRVRRRVAAAVAVLHSGLSDGERARGWNQARLGRARVVLGTRSAVFTPMPRLGLIVVDEEHDLSLKQQDGFRYSARDVAVMRAHSRPCPVVLGSATPSLESLRNVSEGRYVSLHLPQRAGSAAMPRIDLLDIRGVHLEGGLSPALFNAVERELAAGHQVLLFLNRRGYAPAVTCHACGWIADCRRCDAHLILHQADARLRCHHCGAEQRPPTACPACGVADLRVLGRGTERVEEVLAARFPEVGLARIDRDSTRRKGALDSLLEGAHSGDTRLLLGTQMLAKGHHFPDVTLVGILDADQGLYGVDYRASERMAQLIVQVSGRAGRAENPGRVLIQTRHPDHPLLVTLVGEGYAEFARRALDERRQARLPPFSSQALLRAEAMDGAAASEFLEDARTVGAALDTPKGLELWGPVPSPMERRAGRYRCQLLVQAERRAELRAFLGDWVPRLAELKSARRVRWSIDVDPQEMI